MNYKHLVQELREPKRNQVRSFTRKATAKSKIADRVYVRVAKTCPILDNVPENRHPLSDKSEASLSTSSGCSVATIRTEDSKITFNRDGQCTPIVAKLPHQDCSTRGSPSGSQLSTKSLSSLDTLALTELEIWAEIDRRLVVEVEEDGDIKKYFLPDFGQNLIT